jgi:hypothetical protein
MDQYKKIYMNGVDQVEMCKGKVKADCVMEVRYVQCISSLSASGTANPLEDAGNGCQ